MVKVKEQFVGKIISVRGQVVLVNCETEYRPRLRELLVTDDEARAQLEVYSYESAHEMNCLLLSDVCRDMNILSTGTELTIPVGKEVLGRVIDIFGKTHDGQGPLHRDVVHESIYKEHRDSTIRDVSISADDGSRILETGIKAIDFFTPLPKGGKMGLVGGPGVGKTVLMTEIMRNINSQGEDNLTVFAGIGERVREGHELWETLKAADVLKNTALILGHMNENAAIRFKIAWSAATVAEYFRDVSKRDVLFFVDNIFRFVQAGSELSTLLGEIPSEFGYQPTLQTEIAQFESRLKSTSDASITSIQTIYAPADILTNPSIVDTLPHLVAVTILSRDIAHEGRYPALDVLKSKSSVVNEDFVGKEHYEAVTKSIEILNHYERLSRVTAIIGEEEISPEDRKLYQRAQKILNYMTQPFFTTSSQTGRAGVIVSRKDVVRDMHLIVQGRFDSVPAEQLLYVGDLDTAGFSRFM